MSDYSIEELEQELNRRRSLSDARGNDPGNSLYDRTVSSANDDDDQPQNETIEESPYISNSIQDDLQLEGNNVTGHTLRDNTEIPTSDLGVNTQIEVPVNDVVEPVGALDVLSQSFDNRFGTIMNEIGALTQQCDALRVTMSNILTRINLVEDITDNVTTIDNDVLLTQAINRLI